MSETIFLSVLKTAEFCATVEYIPLEDGLIEIVSVHLEPVFRRTNFEQRQAEHRQHRRGIVLGEAEEHAEAMQPYQWIEK